MLLLFLLQPKLPLLLSRMNEVAKVFLATNSDYKYTEVRGQLTVRYVKCFKANTTSNLILS